MSTDVIEAKRNAAYAIKDLHDIASLFVKTHKFFTLGEAIHNHLAVIAESIQIMENEHKELIEKVTLWADTAIKYDALPMPEAQLALDSDDVTSFCDGYIAAMKALKCNIIDLEKGEKHV